MTSHGLPGSQTKQTSRGKECSSAVGYERRVGRWSRLVASQFVNWLKLPGGVQWLDIGSGTGVLCQILLERCAPSRVTGVDSSESQLEYARARVTDERVNFLLGDAQALAFRQGSFDAAVSGLVLNHMPDKVRAVAEMKRVVRPGGRVAGYVWDFAGEMQLMRRFWDAAIELDPTARERDQGRRFPNCKPEPLVNLFMEAGLEEVETRTVDVPTIFRDFDDYWVPMTIGEGSIPDYLLWLTEERLTTLRDRLKRSLPTRADGTIHLIARAWAVSGNNPC